MARKRTWRVHGPYQEEHYGGERWRIVIVSPTGERESIFTKTKATAERAAQQAKVEIAGELTFQEAIFRFETYLLDEEGWKKNSVNTTGIRYRLWLPVDRPLSSYSKKDGQAKYDSRCQEVAVDTHRNELSEIKTFFRWLVANRLLSASPVEDIKPKGRRRHGKPQLHRNEARLFSEMAFKVYREGKRGYEAALGNLISLWLGLRSTEIISLQVRDVDPHPDGIWLWVAEEYEGKTPAARRPVEVPGGLSELLVQQTEGKPSDGWLFPAKTTSGHRGKTWLRRAARVICEEAGVKYVPPHGLRGTQSSITREAGATAHLVATQLGHTNPRVTEQSYHAPGTVERAKTKKALKVLSGGKKE